MSYDLLRHCPDYIRDFPEIQALANSQSIVFAAARIKASSVKSQATFYSESDLWENLLEIDYSDDWEERTYRMLRRYDYISFEEYYNLVECFLEDKYELTVDYENLAVIIRTEKRAYNVGKYETALRNIFPCNMTFKVEYVTKL